MATAGKIAFNTILKYVPRSGARVLVGELTSVNGIELTADEVDMTNHDSLNRFKETLQGLRDSGTVDVVGNHVPGDAGQALIPAHFVDDDDGGRRHMELSFPNGAGFNFYAFVKSYTPSDAPLEGKLEFSASFRCSGEARFGVSRAAGLTTPFFILSEGNASVSPTRQGTTYTYTAEVATGVTSLTVTPTSAAGDSIRVEGAVVASGAASVALPLAIGANVLTVIVYDELFMDARYQITVTRAAAR